MDTRTFDRLVAKLAGIGPRRDAVKAAAAAGIAAVGSRFGTDQSDVGARGKKKRCRSIGQSCGGRKKCCDKHGPTSCQEFPSQLCAGVNLTGKRCCGLEGAKCDPNFGDSLEPPADSPNAVGNCSCCDPFFCAEQPNGVFRCQTEST